MGVWSELPVSSRGRAPGQRGGEVIPQKLKTFQLLDAQRLQQVRLILVFCKLPSQAPNVTVKTRRINLGNNHGKSAVVMSTP